jgi:hypothetical protein
MISERSPRKCSEKIVDQANISRKGLRSVVDEMKVNNDNKYAKLLPKTILSIMLQHFYYCYLFNVTT